MDLESKNIVTEEKRRAKEREEMRVAQDVTADFEKRREARRSI